MHTFVTGIVNQLLSFKGWIPLSRLTYCAYLLNPVIIRSICSYNETPLYFEFVHMVSVRIFKIPTLIAKYAKKY